MQLLRSFPAAFAANKVLANSYKPLAVPHPSIHSARRLFARPPAYSVILTLTFTAPCTPLQQGVAGLPIAADYVETEYSYYNNPYNKVCKTTLQALRLAVEQAYKYTIECGTTATHISPGRSAEVMSQSQSGNPRRCLSTTPQPPWESATAPPQP